MGDETAIQANPNPNLPKPADDGTAIQTAPSAPPVGSFSPRGDELNLTRRKPEGWSVERALASLAGLRLTVFLLAIGLLLVFFGTLAQMDEGIHAILAKYFRCWLAWVPFQIFVRFGQIFLSFPHTWQIGGSFPFPGGWTIGFIMLVNLCAAHAVRFRLTWKRSGVLILHAGLIVLMMGELITGLFSVESRMTIWENGSSSYTESHNTTELAIIDPSDPKTDDVVVIPEGKLHTRDDKPVLIQHEALPFDVEVLEYMVNSSEPRAVKPGAANRATAGEGLSLMVEKIPEVSGTEGDKTDLAATYVTFKEKGTGKPLGTYLLSIWFSHPLLFNKGQSVKVGDKEYTVSLRHQREYKPYTVYLKKFTHELYPGTTIPKNFSSNVRLVDAGRNEDRETDIYMNNPLRYEGETFYQSGFLPGDRGTILQVVHNPGDWLPYWSCILVTIGMMVHFSIGLVGFLSKMRTGDLESLNSAWALWFLSFGLLGLIVWSLASRLKKQHVDYHGSSFAKMFPLLVVGFALLYIGYSLVPRNYVYEKMKLDEFGRLPVLHGGRPKPIDTLARDNLMVISGMQTFKDAKGREQPATKWLLDVMISRFDPNESAMQHKVFRIDHPEVLSLLGLQRRPGYRYAPTEFRDKLGELEREASRAQQVDAKTRSTYENQLVDIAEHLRLYIEISQMEKLLLLPPRSDGGEWQSWPQAKRRSQKIGQKDPAAESLMTLLGAYVENKPDEFNSELETYRGYLETTVPANARRTNFEFSFNAFQAFYICTILYVMVFLLSCFSWLGWSAPLRSAAFWLAVLTLILNTGAFIGRMYMMDRWAVFVTNLYATAVFVGWVIMILALFLEVVFPLGIATAAAGFICFATSILAHYLARSGDTLGMMQAVLDTNFWLATHVTIINIGYGATLLGGMLGVIYLVLAMGTPLINDDMKKFLGQMIYGIICFATLFSFTGTVLGGIWADQSWGRFWGWDPKENGALMIVMWNALILHARWSGLVKQTGVATLAMVGNMITGWSWIGTNQLGVGLHAYGFNNTLALVLTIAWAIHLVLIGVALLPRRWWQSPAAA
jgi:ABC-type transport system involved in cytochrome c biogenesis permease subunit